MTALKLPPFAIFPTLNGEKIILREVRSEDLEALREISYYDGKQAADIGEAKEMQSRIDVDYQAGNSVHWCIVERETGLVLGTCGYYRGFKDGSGELGCILLEQFRGKGFMISALVLAMDFGLQSMGLSSLRAVTSIQNLKALSLLNRLGFEKVAEVNGDVEFVYNIH